MKKYKTNKKPTAVNEILKYEIADELGLSDKIKKYGWKSLTSGESGKIGGIITKRMKEKEKEN